MTRRTLNLFTSVFLMLAFVVLTPERAEADASIVDRQLVSKQRVGRSSYDYTYTLSLAVNGPALDDVRVLVWCDNAGTEITDNEVVFGNVPGNSTTTSSGAEGTFTLRQNRRIPFDESCLNYNIRFVTLLKISGIATDKPLKNATVTVTNSEPVIDASGRPVVDNSGRPVVDNTTIIVTADEDGAYEAELTVTSQDDFIALTADGEVGTDQEDATLTSTVGSVGELHTVGAEGSIVVGSGDSGALNITHITTAQDELVRRLNGGVPPANDAELAALQAQVDGAELIILATAIKTFVDNPDIDLPPGVDNTLEWIQQDPETVDQQIEELQAANPVEFQTALEETADELQLGYSPDEVPGPLFTLIRDDIPVTLEAVVFNFGAGGGGEVILREGASPINWFVNADGEIEVDLLNPPIEESFQFRDPPGAQVRAETFVDAIKIVRLANGIETDQILLLKRTVTTFPDADPPVPDEIDQDVAGSENVYLAFGNEGVQPITSEDIAGNDFFTYYYHQENNAVGFSFPTFNSDLGADRLIFNEDTTGTTQRRGFGFEYSIDAVGTVNLDFLNGDENRFVKYSEDGNITQVLVIGSMSNGVSKVVAGEVIESDGITDFTEPNLVNRRYRSVFATLGNGFAAFDFSFLSNGDGCRISDFDGTFESKRPLQWTSNAGIMDSLLFRSDPSNVIFDNGVFSGVQTNTGNIAGGQELFEDFTIGTDTVITGIEWQQHDHNAATYNFTRVAIFDALPFSAPPVYSGDITAARTPNATGTLFGDWDGFDYEIGGLSIVLPAGTYWIGLNSDFTGTRSGWDNTLGGADTVPGYRLVNGANPAPGTVNPGNLAFRLTGGDPEALAYQRRSWEGIRMEIGDSGDRYWLLEHLQINNNGVTSFPRWRLDEVTFEDGGIATGTIEFDFATSSVVSWDVTVSGGDTGTFASITYNEGNSTVTTFSSSFAQDTIQITQNGTSRQLRITPTGPLDGTSGLVSVELGGFGIGGAEECFNCSPFRPIIGGSLIATIPPATTPGRINAYEFIQDLTPVPNPCAVP